MTDNTINNDMTMDGATGTLLAGRYRVVRQLGQGGMGSVWLAEDMKLDGFKVAIKMLPSVLVNNKRAYAQVKAEALVSLKLSHPNIVAVRAFEEENGNPFLVMDYIDGQTLDDYLAEKGKLTEEETVKLLKPIAAALDCAHAQGVVHRDVKPGNVMIRKDGTPFVLDFGIAREIQETMTRVTGKLSSGTLLYMSPEQLNGEAPKPAQDIYSFAAMAYECLKGEPPFSRGQIEYQIVNNKPDPLGPQFANCGPGVMAGLAKSPEARPMTCVSVLDGGLRCVASAVPVSKTRIVVVGALLALAAIVGVGGWLWREKAKSDELVAERARQVEIATCEAARQKAEAERIAAEKVEVERKARVEAERIAEEKRKVEEARIAAQEAARKASAETERLEAERRKAEEFRLAEEKAEAERKAQEDTDRAAAEASQRAIDLFKMGDWQSGLKQAENADQDDAELLFWLGTCYDIGLGANCDAGKAVGYFRRAAEKGQLDAQCELGRRYELGQGVAKDLAQAKRWYQAAASQGSKTAETSLNRVYDFENASALEASLAWKRAQKEREKAERRTREAVEAEKVRKLQEELAQLKETAKSVHEEPLARAVPTSDRTRSEFDGTSTMILLKFSSKRARSYYERAAELAREGAHNKAKVKADYEKGRTCGGPEWPELEAWLDWWK